MDKNRDKDELDGVELISREQAQAEMQQAIKKLRKTEKPAPHETSSKDTKAGKVEKGSSKVLDDELADVETIPREQAIREIREAAQRAKKMEKKN